VKNNEMRGRRMHKVFSARVSQELLFAMKVRVCVTRAAYNMCNRTNFASCLLPRLTVYRPRLLHTNARMYSVRFCIEARAASRLAKR
jgi:hypothetical protein